MAVAGQKLGESQWNLYLFTSGYRRRFGLAVDQALLIHQALHDLL